MEFDKSKILTVVTADQAKVGQKGWFADTLIGLKKKVANSQPQRLIRVLPDATCSAVFLSESGLAWVLFCPAPEPTYAERQAQWVKENNVKEGTKVRVIRKWKRGDFGFDFGMGATIGEIYDVTYILDKNIAITKDWAVPYFALEVIKEPTYRPYNNDELNDLVGEVLTSKQSGRRKVVTGKLTASEGVNLDGSYITAKDLLASFYRNGNEPCGVREEA